MAPKVSIVMTAYRRAHLLEETLGSIYEQDVTPPPEVIVVEDGFDGGKTRAICHFSRATYLQRVSRPAVAYSNQAPVINKGLKAATGDIVILQNAECAHDGNVIQTLLDHVACDNYVLATCAALNQDGTFQQWYVHPTHNLRPYFFCGAMTRANFLMLGGFEESFTGYGYEDDDFGERAAMAGIRPIFCDALVHHQWHPPYMGPMVDSAAHLQMLRLERKGFVANVGREWGVTP